MFYLNKFLLKRNNFNTFTIGAVVIFICFIFFYLTFFIHPSGDDYTYAFLELKSPFYKAYLDEYLLWNGRYLSNIFVLKNPLTFGFNKVWIYRIFVFIIQLTLFYSFFYIINKFIKPSSLRGRWFLSSSLFVAYLILIPAINEGFYWYTGLATYQLSIIFFLFYLNTLFSKLNYKRIFLLILIQFIVAGFNEVSMLYMNILHLSLLIFRYNKHKNWQRIILFLSCIVFSSFVYLAPGNDIRSSYFQNVSNQFGYSLLMSFIQIVRFGVILNTGFFLFLLVLFFKYQFPHLFSNVKLEKSKNNFFLIPFIIFLILFFSIFPAYWTTGIMGQHRTVNYAFFFCVPLLCYWYILFFYRYDLFFQKIFFRIKNYYVLIFLISISFSKNFHGVITDIYYSKQTHFDLENNKRYSNLNLYHQSNKKKDIYLKRLNTHPFSISVYDLSEDPNNLANIGYQRYWKIQGKVLINHE